MYYRDEIGNISTSNMRELDDSVELELRPRFPLFGGWKTHYYIGYNVPSYQYLFNSGTYNPATESTSPTYADTCPTSPHLQRSECSNQTSAPQNVLRVCCATLVCDFPIVPHPIYGVRGTCWRLRRHSLTLGTVPLQETTTCSR